MKRSALIERRSPWKHPALVVCVRGKYGCHVGLEVLKEAFDGGSGASQWAAGVQP